MSTDLELIQAHRLQRHKTLPQCNAAGSSLLAQLSDGPAKNVLFAEFTDRHGNGRSFLSLAHFSETLAKAQAAAGKPTREMHRATAAAVIAPKPAPAPTVRTPSELVRHVNSLGHAAKRDFLANAKNRGAYQRALDITNYDGTPKQLHGSDAYSHDFNSQFANR